MSRGNGLVGLLVVAAAPICAGCVSSGAYEAAMLEAQNARLAAARSEAEVRALEGTVASMSRRLDAQEAGPQWRRCACAADPTPPQDPSNAATHRPLDREDPWGPGPRAARPVAISKASPPLDRDDPWGPAQPPKTPPLDAADPW